MTFTVELPLQRKQKDPGPRAPCSSWLRPRGPRAAPPALWGGAAGASGAPRALRPLSGERHEVRGTGTRHCPQQRAGHTAALGLGTPGYSRALHAGGGRWGAPVYAARPPPGCRLLPLWQLLLPRPAGGPAWVLVHTRLALSRVPVALGGVHTACVTQTRIGHLGSPEVPAAWRQGSRPRFASRCDGTLVHAHLLPGPQYVTCTLGDVGYRPTRDTARHRAVKLLRQLARPEGPGVIRRHHASRDTGTRGARLSPTRETGTGPRGTRAASFHGGRPASRGGGRRADGNPEGNTRGRRTNWTRSESRAPWAEEVTGPRPA